MSSVLITAVQNEQLIQRMRLVTIAGTVDLIFILSFFTLLLLALNGQASLLSYIVFLLIAVTVLTFLTISECMAILHFQITGSFRRR